jgi:hypothetical protein
MRYRAVLTAVVAFGSLAAVAYGGSPHFVSCTPSVDGAEVCVFGKEAGLGDEDQINLTLTVVAHCQNPGGHDPNAANKETFGADFQRPTQNGKALYDVCVTTDFQPDCAPPMTVVVDTISLVDTTNDIACSQLNE